jgi:NAD(P)-dependent dehydrogenase (short-subunit alcohol dehydrogenase family)
MFESVIKTNLTSVFFTVQAALPHLNDNASVILNGSVISVLGNPGYSAYAATKAGVRSMARDGERVVAAWHPRQSCRTGRGAHADLEWRYSDT